MHLLDLKKKKPHLVTLGLNLARENVPPMEKFLVYLEEHDENELCDKIALALENLNFSEQEVGFVEIAQTLKMTNRLL